MQATLPDGNQIIHSPRYWEDQALNVSEFNSVTEIVNSEEASFFLAMWACGVEVLGEELEPIFRDRNYV